MLNQQAQGLVLLANSNREAPPAVTATMYTFY